MAKQDIKTQMVFDYLVTFLEKNKFSSNNKLPSETILSKDLAVSRSTVRKALDILVQDGYIFKVQGAGAFFNKDRDFNKDAYLHNDNKFKYKIALILQGQDTSANSQFKKGLDSVFKDKNIYLKVYITDNKFVNERECIKTLMHEGFDGFIVDGVKASLLNPNLSLYKECLETLNIPVIFYNNYYKELDYPKVLTNGRASCAKVTEHLIKLGHKKIGGIFLCDNYQAVEKFQGMYETLQDNGIDFRDRYLKWCVSDDLHDVSFQKNIEAFLDKIPNATALICCNSIIYKYVKDLLALRSHNLLVVGLDIAPDFVKKHDITCTIERGFDIGKKVGSNLLLMIENKDFKGQSDNYSSVLPPILHIQKEKDKGK